MRTPDLYVTYKQMGTVLPSSSLILLRRAYKAIAVSLTPVPAIRLILSLKGTQDLYLNNDYWPKPSKHKSLNTFVLTCQVLAES